MPNIPLVNGTSYSWANVKCNLFGVPVVGITEINFNNKQKKENNYGQGVNPISRGYGNIEPEADISIYWDEWIKIINAAPNKEPLAIPHFDIQILFGGSSVSFQQVNLRACEFMEDPFSAKQGDNKLVIKIPLIVAQIEHV